VFGEGRELPSELAGATLLDAGARETTLAEIVGKRSAVIVFLRHFGCIGCSQQVDALVPILDELSDLGVAVVLVGNGDPLQMGDFIERQRLVGYPVTLVTDPTLRSFGAAGFDRSTWATIGPRALWADLVGMAKGYFSHGVRGDRLQQGGILVVSGDGRLVLRRANRAAPEPIAANIILDAVLSTVASSDPARKRIA
jgi:peroxiredoxin